MDPVDLICFHCTHFQRFKGGCRAFHEGIPSEILRSNRHNKPLEGQKNVLVYTPIAYKHLNGEALFNCFIQDHPNKDYSSVVALLPVACGWDMAKVYKLLERSIAENKGFIAVYPGIENTDTSKMEYIGEIIDGSLHLS